jgi:flagellar hook assembly protein FlgD
MKPKYSLLKSSCLFAGLLCLASLRLAQAQTITSASITAPNPILYETGLSNGTTISFTTDEPGLVQIAINCGIVNAGDTGTNVANLNYSVGSSSSVFWNGLWLIGGDYGRTATSCNFTLTLSTAGTSSSPYVISQLVTFNSVDIHNVSVTPSVSASGADTFPYAISYTLAKEANVTATISNSSNTVVSTLLSNQAQAASTMTFTWNGQTTAGTPVPLGVYTLTINATDPAVSGSIAITRTRTIIVQSLAGAAGDPQAQFESNTFVYPNPVRNGQGTFQLEAVRDGTNLSIRVYTLTGTLVWEQHFYGLSAGTIETIPWNVTNESGRKLGRGLYYYVVREDDSVGTLQTVKKMAILP